jgi:hypothetical protein
MQFIKSHRSNNEMTTATQWRHCNDKMTMKTIVTRMMCENRGIKETLIKYNEKVYGACPPWTLTWQ